MTLPDDRPAARGTAPGTPALRVEEAPQKRSSPLGLRVASGLLFAPLLILLVRSGGWAFLAFVGLEVTLGLIEFYRMMRAKGLAPFAWFGTAKPFAGQTVVVAGITRPLVSGPILEYGPKWTETSGATVELVEFPFADLINKLMIWPSTADQSAPERERKVHGSHRRADGNGPSNQSP